MRGGDRLEIAVMPNSRLMLKPKRLIDADDAAYRLGKEILEAEGQIRQGKVVPWSAVKRRHKL